MFNLHLSSKWKNAFITDLNAFRIEMNFHVFFVKEGGALMHV